LLGAPVVGRRYLGPKAYDKKSNWRASFGKSLIPLRFAEITLLSWEDGARHPCKVGTKICAVRIK
jgi:hypothetical protein